ncbi:MAG: FecR family protein [Pedobacter sp.]|nr:MAG: FecR family protein [Pedobacter sp.]
MEDQVWNNILKRLTNVETEFSKAELDSWLSENAKNVKIYKETEALWYLTGALPASKIAKNEMLIHPIAEKNRKKAFRTVMRYSIAASVAIISSLTIFYLSKSNNQSANQIVAQTFHKATNGKILKLVLPDSSIVWLNSGSEISYPKVFTGQKTRAIELSGEAFFEVTHNQKQPFVVKSGDLKTVVYGTSFNVKAYKSSKQNAVTVKTGKVGVLLDNDSLSKPTMLLPGKGLIYHRDKGRIEKTEMLTADVAIWLKGDLIFDQATPNEVFAMLSRRFDVEFKYDDADFTGCKLTAKFPNQHLKVIMQTISNSLDFKYKEHGKIIEILGGKPCK